MKAKSISLASLISLFFVSSMVPGNTLKCQEKQNPLPQFLFPSFAKGIVLMNDGRKMTAILDYNMVDEEMVFQQGNTYMVLDKPEEVDTVFLQNRKFVYIEKAFYEVTVKGSLPFFIQHKSKYTQAGTNTAYGMKSQTNAEISYSSFKSGNQVRQIDVPDNMTVTPATSYWVKQNGELKKFTTERQLFKLFPDMEKEIKEFISKSGADIKTREGLMKVGNFINGLEK